MFRDNSDVFISVVVCIVGLSELSKHLGTSEAVVQLMVEALQKPPDHDFRSELSKPLFRRGVTSMEDLQPGAFLTGIV